MRLPAFRPLGAFLALSSAFAFLPVRSAPPVDRLKVPAGFQVELLTDRVPNARAMTLGRFESGSGKLFVGSMRAGNVYAVDLDRGRAANVRTIASGLAMPVGVAYRNGSLFVSAVSRILRLDGVDESSDGARPPVVVTERFPSETHHGWKFIAFGPDGDLYVPVGAPCNVCERDENRYYNIQKVGADGRSASVVARGVRNSVGFDWSPTDGSLWFTEHGRDMLGDDVPNDELNRIPPGTGPAPHFGFPYCHQGDVADPEFGSRNPCSRFTPPVARLGAHVAAVGMRFYAPAASASEAFPARYRNGIFIAEHGSWNRSRKSGYRVVHIAVDGAGKVTGETVFAEGWLGGDESVWGRPADVLPMPDGSLLVSDDLAGAIYRIRYAPR